MPTVKTADVAAQPSAFPTTDITAHFPADCATDIEQADWSADRAPE